MTHPLLPPRPPPNATKADLRSVIYELRAQLVHETEEHFKTHEAHRQATLIGITLQGELGAAENERDELKAKLHEAGLREAALLVEVDRLQKSNERLRTVASSCHEHIEKWENRFDALLRIKAENGHH